MKFFRCIIFLLLTQRQLQKCLPMTCMIAGAIVNTIPDPVFIFHWGISGAAFATVPGQIISFILAMRYLWHFKILPLILLLPFRFGIMGVLFAEPIADFSAFVLSVVLVNIELKKQKIPRSPTLCKIIL